MKFVPVNKNNLKAMFEAMSECQALHPDPQDNYTDGKFLLRSITKIQNTFLFIFQLNL